MKNRFNHVQVKMGFWSRLKYLFRGETINILMRYDNKRWVVHGVTFGEGEKVNGET